MRKTSKSSDLLPNSSHVNQKRVKYTMKPHLCMYTVQSNCRSNPAVDQVYMMNQINSSSFSLPVSGPAAASYWCTSLVSRFVPSFQLSYLISCVVASLFSFLLLGTSSVHARPTSHAHPAQKKAQQHDQHTHINRKSNRKRPQHQNKVMRLLRSKLIPPHLLRRFAQELQLTQEQQTTLRHLIKTYKIEEIDHKFKQEDAVHHLRQLIQGDHWNDKEVIQKTKVLMQLKQELKTKRLTLALKARALLTAEQLKKAHKIKEKHGPTARHSRGEFHREFRGNHD